MSLRDCFGLGLSVCAVTGVLSVAPLARAQDPMGVPPKDIDKAAAGPAAPVDPLKIDKPPEGITASVSAGGLTSSGNSKAVAFTGSGAFDLRSGANGFGASLIGNYGESAPPGGDLVLSTENIQGRLRYDRYFLDNASVFLLLTGRHDRFQGLAFRFNVDPGVKYLFVNRAATALWGELGYDFQYDIRTDEGRESRDEAGVLLETLDKTATDHSVRAYLGFRHSFSKEVTLSNGIEYLQSFIESERYRMNYDLLFAANVWGSLAVGAGFNARFDNAPLPDKEKLDTQTTLNLVYSYTNVEKK